MSKFFIKFLTVNFNITFFLNLVIINYLTTIKYILIKKKLVRIPFYDKKLLR